MTRTCTLPVGPRTLRRGLPTVLVALAVATLPACGQPAGARPAQTPVTTPSPVTVPSTPLPRLAPSTSTTTTAPRPVGGPGPSSGTVLTRVGGGRGELSVENGTGRDAVVTLARDGSTRVRVYVRAGASATVGKIADGVYTLYSTTGVGWDTASKAFVSDVRARRFDDTFEFTTTSRQSTRWSITLQAVAGGTASASDVDASLVPG